MHTDLMMDDPLRQYLIIRGGQPAHVDALAGE
jgi:hypothetical protein